MQEKHTEMDQQVLSFSAPSNSWKNAACYTLHFRSVQLLHALHCTQRISPCLDYPRIVFIICNQITEEFLSAHWTCKKKILDLHNEQTSEQGGESLYKQFRGCSWEHASFGFTKQYFLQAMQKAFFFFPLKATFRYIYNAYKICWFICTCNEHNKLFLCLCVAFPPKKRLVMIIQHKVKTLT